MAPSSTTTLDLAMDTLGQAVEQACRATQSGFRRMNYEILGNTDAYLHAHLFPRYEWEPPNRIGHPVWLYDAEEFYADDVALASRHDELRERIVAELRSLADVGDCQISGVTGHWHS